MTSTDNIIDAAGMCIIYDYLSTSQPLLNKMSRSAPAKAGKYIAVSIHWGKYCGHCLSGGKLPAPLEKIGRFAHTKGKFGSINN